MPREAKISALVLIILCGLGGLCSDVFFTSANLVNILTASATIGILSIGASFVLAAKKLDLSIGSFMALTAIFGATFGHSGTGIIGLTLLCGVVTGLINGVMVGFLKLPSFIVTLAMLGLARGVALVISDGDPIYDLSPSVIYIGQGEIFGVPVPVILFALLAALCGLILNYTKFGIQTLCIGDNENACARAGIKITRHNMILFSLSALLSAVAGLIYMGRVNAADPAAGAGYELLAITAAIIGGTSIFGGKTSIFGTVCGALILSVIQNCLTLLNISAYYQEILIGLILIFAISLEKVKIYPRGMR
ncbi:MAG: ABC transporter permease [Alphaproteobacteria bacterium]|nr:ABC transporter permease [Alphaproteobacteria bacterium]